MTDAINRGGVLSAPNAEFLEHLYQQFLAEPDSLEADWQQFFRTLGNGGVAGNGGMSAARGSEAVAAQLAELAQDVGLLEGKLGKQAAVYQLITNFRRFGHTRAKLDPLGQPHVSAPPDLSLAHFGLNEADLDEVFSTGVLVAKPMATLREIYDQVSQTYCGSVGVEFMHVNNQAERIWLRQVMEASRNRPVFTKAIKLAILTKLTQAEVFEKFLHTQFIGQKRFSQEGAESMIVLLEGLVEQGAEMGVREMVIGMPHRGRLNTLINILGKKAENIFAEFEDTGEVDELTGSGDVKYHMGYASDREFPDGHKMHLSLTFNPSHLEAVNPVVLGNVRAKQDRRGDPTRSAFVPVMLHGDAAFAGQGIVMETLNLAGLPGYTTGGTIHIIVNNQIGFTTAPRLSRSGHYPTDVCKMLDVPVLHVNGDDPEAVLHVTRMALAFRQEFHTDIIIDLFCYRRLGHNESDEPEFTQPLTYKKIKALPTTLDLYSGRLIEQGVLSRKEAEKIKSDFRAELSAALKTTREAHVEPIRGTLAGAWLGLKRGVPDYIVLTEVDLEYLERIAEVLAGTPEDFTPHPRLKRLLQSRRDMIAGKVPIDWGFGELLAYGSLVNEGFHVRLSGQDSSRGTFSHRHANLVDVNTGRDYCALQHIKPDQGEFLVVDSPLSEFGVLGFEFGFSLAAPFTLTIWEAQFGDFANGAQVMIDQFIASSEEKWLRMSGLVLLLPHGFEGQGPEHSSARLERFLQLCADRNIQVCAPTTPAQYFHMVRRQLHRNFRKPLVVMSPKSLLRHPMATNTTEDLIKGHFREVLYERDKLQPAKVKRVVFCSGKLYYDLLAERNQREFKHVALIRVEQLYPFPDEQITTVFSQYPKASDFVWAQEEPKNMGAWDFVVHRFRALLPPEKWPRYVGRRAAAAPATGSHHVHDREQRDLVEKALG